MKNILKLSGIMVLLAVIGFSFAACGGGSPSDEDTYTGAIFIISDDDYEAAFIGETAPTVQTFGTLSGERDDLIAKVDIAMDSNSYDELIADMGLSYAEVEGAVESYLVDNLYISSDQQKELMDELNSNGYVVGFIGLPNDEVGVAAAYRE